MSALAALYIALNVAASTTIVFANKAVYALYAFNFPTALTFFHLLFTAVGMTALGQMGMFKIKPFPAASLQALAASYVGYVVLGNVSLKMNPVGFYQITKILVGPTVMCLEIVQHQKLPSMRIVASVVLLSVGVALATVSDSQVMSKQMGIIVGLASVTATACYNVLAGYKQTALEASSSQLVQQFSPYAALMLAVLVPILEPTGVGIPNPGPDTILGYRVTWQSAVVITLSSAMGLLVALSTFLVIRHTSALTYNVLGHIKTVVILAGGCIFYGEIMPLKKLAGLGLALGSIFWYSYIKMNEKKAPTKGAAPKSRARSKAGEVQPLLHASNNGSESRTNGSLSISNSQQNLARAGDSASLTTSLLPVRPDGQVERV